MLGGLRTFFITFMYGYTVELFLFDLIMHKALYEHERFVLRFLFPYTNSLVLVCSFGMSDSLLLLC